MSPVNFLDNDQEVPTYVLCFAHPVRQNLIPYQIHRQQAT